MISCTLPVAQLKKEFEERVGGTTPEEIKRGRLFDVDEEGEIHFTLTKELVVRLGLHAWLANYREEASHSTGGIRGPQNIKYWWDWRFPLHGVGIALATIAKARLLRQELGARTIRKILGGEVRYHTQVYIDLIARIEAALGIEVHCVPDRKTLPVWLASFLTFLLDYDGGEYVTSSHGISSKIATKDLNNEGGQFMPEESLRFVDEIERVIHEAETSPKGFPITLAPRHDPCIREDVEGIPEYGAYLRMSVATSENIALIKRAAQKGLKVLFDFIGGCMARTMVPLLTQLGIAGAFQWHRSEEDPFFHGVGKTYRLNPMTGREEYFDYSCDTTLMEVIQTLGYEDTLRDKPVGYPVFITDPDGDRLVLAEVQDARRIPELDSLGIDHIPLDARRVLVVYMPNQSFLMTIDFHARSLRTSGRWNDHGRFMIKTTLSAAMWDEWAAANQVAVVNVPVGFKEISHVMKKVEAQLDARADRILVRDVYGNTIDLGRDPRLLFGGEESGGMIIGPEEFVVSRAGRRAIAMREKSAGEASIITAALAANLYLAKKTFLDYYVGMLEEYRIRYRYNVRGQVAYYNESEPDPLELMRTKQEGERARDKNDNYFLALAIARREQFITIAQVREILREAFPRLQFDDLREAHFVGDGTLLAFAGKSVEVRKSGTDAKTRAAAFGVNKQECELYLNAFLNYGGDLTPLYERSLPSAFRAQAPSRARELYLEFLHRA
ncbi:MAG: hypothetical protein AB1352_01285 [Patescibacteria group bacterium]